MIHTQGPWEVHDTYSSHDLTTRHWKTQVSAGINYVASAYGNTEAESQANARLIAAAQELLEALKNARTILDLKFKDEDGLESCIESIHAAIAKATGGAR